jgi:outer membrane protein OmpA-like peptidoglycan-associated protein
VIKGQETTIINQYPDDGAQRDYQLQQSDKYTFIVNYYTPKETAEEQAAHLVSTALDLYIDKSYQIGDDHLILSKNPSMMLSEMSSMANQGLEVFQIRDVFFGFSLKVYDKLKSLDAMSWSEVEYELLGDSQEERKEMLTYFINSEILDLKGLCKAEISAFLKNEKAMELPDVWAKKLYQSSDIESPISYQTEDFIPPLEYTLDEPITSNGIDQELSLPKSFVDDYNRQIKKQNKRSRRNKDQFSQEVLALLEQNSTQLISIQKDLAEFQKDNIVRDREIRKDNNEQVLVLQNQIDQLKDMIYSDQRAPKELSIYENANEKLIIYFEKNSAKLSTQYEMELNKSLGILLKNPKLKVMITGYADKSGNPDFNSYISRKRAEEVKNYLNKKGISSKRMIMNYVGDISSNSENSGDRRVEIEYINEIGQLDFSSN